MFILDKDFAPEKGGITSSALKIMRPLDVAKAPEDFRTAWSALIQELEVEETEGVKRGNETNEQFRDRLGVLMRKSSSAYANLEAVASRYVPAIKERIARRVAK